MYMDVGQGNCKEIYWSKTRENMRKGKKCTNLQGNNKGLNNLMWESEKGKIQVWKVWILKRENVEMENEKTRKKRKWKKAERKFIKDVELGN